MWVFEIALGVLRLFPSACIRTGPKHRQRDFELLELGLWTWPVQPQTRGWLNKVWICNNVYVLMSWPCQGTQDQGAQKHCGEAPCAKGESLNQMLELSIHCSVSIWIWYIYIILGLHQGQCADQSIWQQHIFGEWGWFKLIFRLTYNLRPWNLKLIIWN